MATDAHRGAAGGGRRADARPALGRAADFPYTFQGLTVDGLWCVSAVDALVASLAIDAIPTSSPAPAASPAG